MGTSTHPPTPGELRQFALTTGAIVVGLFGLLLPWLFDRALPLWPWVVAGVLIALGLAVPKALAPVHKGWLAFGHVLGWINTRIILGILFYILVLPTGLLMRLLGKDPMHRRRDPIAGSYRKASTEPPKNHFERPF